MELSPEQHLAEIKKMLPAWYTEESILNRKSWMDGKAHKADAIKWLVEQYEKLQQENKMMKEALEDIRRGGHIIKSGHLEKHIPVVPRRLAHRILEQLSQDTLSSL